MIIEIRCVKNADGTYNAASFENGRSIVGKDYGVDRGNCDDIRALWNKLQSTYSDNSIKVKGECIECFEESEI